MPKQNFNEKLTVHHANSYMQFRNKIGLNIGGKYLRERGEVSLVSFYHERYENQFKADLNYVVDKQTIDMVK